MVQKEQNSHKHEKEKMIAAQKTAKEFIYDGFIVGVGTGSTVKYFIQELGILAEEDDLEIITIPSSYETHIELVKAGLSVSTLIDYPELEVYADSADIVTKDFSLIKGGGGAFTREKILSNASKDFIIMIDSSKYPRELTSYSVPVEIINDAINTVIKPIFELGGELRIRYGIGKIGPIISDNGNIIGDVIFHKDYNPFKMEKELNNIPGIIENGLFPKGPHRIVIGQENKAKVIVRENNVTTMQ